MGLLSGTWKVNQIVAVISNLNAYCQSAIDN